MLQHAQHPTQIFGTPQCTDNMVEDMEIETEEECNVPTLKVKFTLNQFYRDNLIDTLRSFN